VIHFTGTRMIQHSGNDYKIIYHLPWE